MCVAVNADGEMMPFKTTPAAFIHLQHSSMCSVSSSVDPHRASNNGWAGFHQANSALSPSRQRTPIKPAPVERGQAWKTHGIACEPEGRGNRAKLFKDQLPLHMRRSCVGVVIPPDDGDRQTQLWGSLSRPSGGTIITVSLW